MAPYCGIERVPNSSVSCSKPTTACFNLFSQICFLPSPWTFSNAHIPSTQAKWTLILFPVHFPHTYLWAFAVMIFPPAPELCSSLTWPFLSNFSNPVLAWRWIFIALCLPPPTWIFAPSLSELNSCLSGKRHTVWRQRTWVQIQLHHLLAVWFL